MSGKPFGEGIDELKAIIGEGTLTAEIVVDQIYAAPQEREFWVSGPNAGVRIRNHPGGGIGHFLGSQIEGAGFRDMHQWVSDAIGERRPIAESAAVTVDEYIRGIENLAPRELGNLRRSGAGTVTSDGAVVYKREPQVPRLSREQLKALRRARPSRSGDRRRRRAF